MARGHAPLPKTFLGIKIYLPLEFVSVCAFILISQNCTTTNKPTPNFLQALMLFLTSNQQRRSTEGKISHFTDFLTASSPACLATLSL